MSPPVRVVVLMSTYNGERFVGEQIRSILAQLPADGLLMIRDDGSSDGTIREIAECPDARVSLTRGTNIGFARSFLTLLQDVPDDADVVLFADQDDVWLPGKIDRARSALSTLVHRPALYCSAQMLTDDRLHPTHATPSWPRQPSFDNALSENIVTGCTAALNQAGATLVRHAGVPDSVRFHDWWMYLVVSAFGTVVFDPEPTLLYRQHSQNQIGHGSGWWGRQVRILRFLRRHDWVGILLGQIAALVAHFGDRLTSEQRGLLDRYFDTSRERVEPRWRLLWSPRRWRQYWYGEATFRILMFIYLARIWPPATRRLAR